MAGRALHGHIAKRIVPDFLAVDAADEVAVFVREVPCVAATDAVIAVVEYVDFIAVEDGIATSVDINLPAGEAHLTTVAQVLVVLGAILRFAGGHLVVRVLEPEVVLVRHDILRGHRKACHQGEAKSKQSCFHKAMILRVRHVCLSITNRVPKPLLPLFCYLLKMLQSPADEGGDVRHEGLTAGGEAVLHSRRHFGINLPADKPYLFKPFERYDQLVYFVLPIAEMDYYDLNPNPTPPVFKHFDLISGEVSNGFIGERFSK